MRGLALVWASTKRQTWMKASTAPAGAKLIENLLAKGWIERRGTGNELSYRITDKGLAAKKMPVRITVNRRLAKLGLKAK